MTHALVHTSNDTRPSSIYITFPLSCAYLRLRFFVLMLLRYHFLIGFTTCLHRPALTAGLMAAAMRSVPWWIEPYAPWPSLLAKSTTTKCRCRRFLFMGKLSFKPEFLDTPKKVDSRFSRGECFFPKDGCWFLYGRIGWLLRNPRFFLGGGGPILHIFWHGVWVRVGGFHLFAPRSFSRHFFKENSNNSFEQSNNCECIQNLPLSSWNYYASQVAHNPNTWYYCAPQFLSFQHMTPSKIQSGGVQPFFANREDWPLSRVSITGYAPAIEFSSEMPLQWNLIASYISWLILGAAKGLEMIKIPFVWNNFGSIEFIASQGRFRNRSWLNSLTNDFLKITHCCIQLPAIQGVVRGNETLKGIHGKMVGGFFSLKKRPFLSWNQRPQEVAWMLLECRHAQGGPVWPIDWRRTNSPPGKIVCFFSTGNTCRCHGWIFCSMLVYHSFLGGLNKRLC